MQLSYPYDNKRVKTTRHYYKIYPILIKFWEMKKKISFT